MKSNDMPSQVLEQLGLIAVLAARVEDCAWTMHHCLADDPAKARQRWQRRIPLGQTLSEVTKLAPRRFAPQFAAEVVTWVSQARDLLNQRNDTIHALWVPVDAPGRTMQVRVRPGFQPEHLESFQPEIVSLDDLRELARLLGRR